MHFIADFIKVEQNYFQEDEEGESSRGKQEKFVTENKKLNVFDSFIASDSEDVANSEIPGEQTH